MRGFLLFILVAKTTADRLGYAYEPLGQVAAFGIATGGVANNVGTGFEQIITNTNTFGITDAFSSGLGGFDSGHNNINSNINGDVNHLNINSNHNNDINTFNSFNTITASNGNPAGANGFGNSHSNSASQLDAEFFKEFYSYKAPQEEDDGFSDADIGALGPVRKNLRVIFIKAPENQALTNAALQLAKQATEDRTAIYVLSKQTDVAELANRLQTIQSSHKANKPEVHFVKYRTPEDAVRAQQAIQAQYDALGGATLSNNAAVAPVLNFATSAAIVAGGTGFGGAHNTAAYLPPTF